MQCDRRLDFSPRARLESVLPAYSYREFLLNGFDRSEGQAVDLDPEPTGAFSSDRLIEILHACYPVLGLGELARLIRCLTTAFADIAVEDLSRRYGLRESERLRDTRERLLATPRAFQDWVDEKSLSPRDLAPLLAVPSTDFPRLEAWLSAWPGLSFSRSDGVRAFELAIELFLMNSPDFAPGDESAAAYLARLQRARRPMAESADETWRERVRRWPWPKQVQGKWSRFGDESGLEISLRASSAQDLQQKLKILSTIGEGWK